MNPFQTEFKSSSSNTKLFPSITQTHYQRDPDHVIQLTSCNQHTSHHAINTHHAIELTKDATIPKHRIYPLTSEQDDEVKKQLEKYLAAGQMQRSDSPFGASTLFAKKQDGTQQLCIDYRALRKISKSSKRHHSQSRIPITTHKRNKRRFCTLRILHKNLPTARLPPNTLTPRFRQENRLADKIWHISLFSDAIWLVQFTCHLPENHSFT